MRRILVIHGPNLNLLGGREPDIYGVETLERINRLIAEEAARLEFKAEPFQSNHEGEILERIQSARGTFEGIVLNPAALTHTSVALRDAVVASGVPTVEVHLSNTLGREEFRHVSYVGGACLGRIEGFGAVSYLLALRALKSFFDRKAS